jgi:hypothetical protein
MRLRRAIAIAACLLPVTAGVATAQFQAPPVMMPPQPQQEPPCLKDFVKLRGEAQARAKAIQDASAHKPSPQEACKLFNAFSAAEDKLIKFAVANASWCGIPANVVDSMKQQHTKTAEIRTRICRVAAAPPRPAGPSLSDALSAPVPDSNNIKTGRGTYDTLTGTTLGK